MAIYLGNGGVRQVQEIYVGVDGKPRKVKEGYVGVGGVPRRFYASFPAPGKALNEYTWEEIRQIADAGLAQEYFKVGDTKAVHLKGTVSKLALDDTYYVYILGFDHNLEIDPGAKDAIDFGTWKDAGGKDIALVSGYGQGSDFYMNKTGTNAGGWMNSYMRNTILGSTKNKNDDAGEDTATSPKENTLMSCLPEDLRAVMKPMAVWTDNAGNSSTGMAGVSSTVDYLPLLAEYEVFGTFSSANMYETFSQYQYAYFRDGGSKVKYRSDSTGSSALWWTRSPSRYDGSKFCLVNSFSKATSTPAGDSYGVAPVFRV